VGAVLELAILGPFEVRIDGGAPIALGGLRQKALLAVLVLHANEVVSTDRLIDELWGESVPPTAVHTVQVFVSRLRRALADAGERLVTRPPGYLLELGADEVDAARCERLYSAAHAALAADDPVGAVRLLNDAQALWRGPPLADFAYEPFAQAAIARLEELRVGCREALIEAKLELGRHAELVSDLEALVREHPLRERPRGQLMLALYRCGRQAEALEAFQQARRLLVEELAVEPSQALRELEQLILRQDPSLQAPEADTAVAEDSPIYQEGPAGQEKEAVDTEEWAEPIVRTTATVLVGRIGPSGQPDLEMARQSIARARERAGHVVARHGGAFVGALGGELVWVFGVPVVREDDALRALRAAAELHTELLASTEADPSRLTVRLGVASGEVVAEAPGDVFGEPLNRGMSLTQAADDGETLLADETRRLASTAVRVEPTHDPTAWRLVELVSDTPVPLELGSPMVGRDEELASAVATFRRAVQLGEAHLLTVSGDAGIGKSRFAKELADCLISDATVLTGRCLSYGEGIAYWPLREALTRVAGGESREAIHHLLEGAEDADIVADTIATTLGLAPAESVAEQVPWAFRRLLEVLAARRPVLLVIEDAHWADPALLDLVDYVIDWLRAPTLLLCLARPELFDARPGWGGGRARITSLLLGSLADDDALQLLRHYLGGQQLSDVEQARILETAEGNPLFVEQLLQMHAEDPWWDRARQIPATIQSLLAARLDRLGPGERAFIERAAVIGREFWPSAVVDLLPEGARESAGHHLRALVHRGLIQPTRSILSGEEQLHFHHILIRDVAYRITPMWARADLHERFAEWLRQRDEPYDEFIGYHLGQAFRCRRELGQTDAPVIALAVMAAESLSAAGRTALSRGDTNAAVSLLRSSADLLEAGDRARPDVLLDLGSALSETGEFADAERVLQAAFEQAQAINATAVEARALIELSYWRSRAFSSAHVDEILAIAEEAIELFKPVGDHGGLARAWLHIAWAHWIRAHGAKMEPALEQALAYAARAGEPREASRALMYLARSLVYGPRPVHDAIPRCRVILERAGGDVAAAAFINAMLAVLEAMDGRFDDARDRWRQSKQRLVELGLSHTVAVIRMSYGFIELLANRPDAAEPEVAEAYALFERIGDRGRLSSAAVILARLLYAQGRYEEAEKFNAVAQAAASEEDIEPQVLWRAMRAKILARAGNMRLAKRLSDGAVALARESDFLFLYGQTLSDRAEAMALLAEPEIAAKDLAKAITVYERKGIQSSATVARRAQRALEATFAGAGTPSAVG